VKYPGLFYRLGQQGSQNVGTYVSVNTTSCPKDRNYHQNASLILKTGKNKILYFTAYLNILVAYNALTVIADKKK
jgi:hypothetical protein